MLNRIDRKRNTLLHKKRQGAADRQETAPRSTPVNPGPGERHSRLDHQLERQPETLHLDQDRRRHPRTPRLIYSTDPWRRTLGEMNEIRHGVDEPTRQLR